MIRDFRAPEVFDPPAQNRGDLGERPGHLAFLIPTCTLVASGSARLSTSGWLRVPFIKER